MGPRPDGGVAGPRPRPKRTYGRMMVITACSDNLTNNQPSTHASAGTAQQVVWLRPSTGVMVLLRARSPAPCRPPSTPAPWRPCIPHPTARPFSKGPTTVAAPHSHAVLSGGRQRFIALLCPPCVPCPPFPRACPRAYALRACAFWPHAYLWRARTQPATGAGGERAWQSTRSLFSALDSLAEFYAEQEREQVRASCGPWPCACGPFQVQVRAQVPGGGAVRCAIPCCCAMHMQRSAAL